MTTDTIKSNIKAINEAIESLESLPAFMLDSYEADRRVQETKQLTMATLEASEATHGAGSKEHDKTLDALAASVAWLLSN